MNGGVLKPARLLRGARTAAVGLIDAALPQTCAGCQHWIPAAATALCDACTAALGKVTDIPYCARCGRSTPPVGGPEEGCRGCRSEPFWNVREFVRFGVYEDVLRTMILRLKYRGEERNAAILGDALGAAIAERAWAAQLDLLVPVPMHWLRRLQRPCDHALLLAESAARRLGRKVARITRRARHGPSQTGMASRAARFENVKGCFATARSLDLARKFADQFAFWRRFEIAGKTVCVIDNMTASGATVCEVSKVLRRAGAKNIYAAVIARSVLPGDVQAHVSGQTNAGRETLTPTASALPAESAPPA